jgi:phospholipid/cholesterol/gamma-HCH transport system permease protein
MAAPTHLGKPRVSEHLEGDVMEVALGGTWRITEPRPSWSVYLNERLPKRVRLRVDGIERWDTSLLLFLFEVQEWCRSTGASCETDALPQKVQSLLSQLMASHATSVPFDRSGSFLATVGTATLDLYQKALAMSQFVGECVIGAARVVKSPQKFRWRDCVDEMQQCGAMALPIVSLIAFLVGVTLAYTGALVLRQYGGDIYVADLIGLAVVREMGAVMTGVVLDRRGVCSDLG